MSSGGNSNEVSGANSYARTARDSMVPNDASGNFSGQTYSGTDSQRLIDSYEAIFGPAGRDIKHDPQRHKRHQRWHLPDNLKGRNEYLTDRIDGLITDATSSPFTRNILPYVYLESPDQKIKWNVYSFDEGMASRVPYESAARVLTQSKTSHAGYAVRQGLAIVMEHNFLASAAGMANFQNQLKQLVGSIQLTNDLDVHIALLQAQSYQKTINEKYYSENDSLYDAARRYVDMFGVMQKMPNALDILIEDAKNHLKTWGSQPPTFLLCPSDLTAQLQMNPERTNYITNGPDGLKRLAQGPDLPSYRGLSIIHSQKFSLEPGRKPRNVLKRRVRVAEYYWIPLGDVNSYQIYNQKRDMMTTFDKTHALKASHPEDIFDVDFPEEYFGPKPGQYAKFESVLRDGYCLLIRPNIEHEMLTVIAGRGGTQELGATFWGQTELACYDDAQHGIWGMSYKYHERAIVTNERNLIRMHDVAFDGYGGGMDTDIVKLNELHDYTSQTYDNQPAFRGKSVIALHFPRYLPSRDVTNDFVGMMMDAFVCDGPERDSTTLTPNQLTFRRHILDAIVNSFKANFTGDDLKNIDTLTKEIAELMSLRGNRTAAQDQELADKTTERTALLADNQSLPRAKLLIRVIKYTNEVYIQQKPYEDPLEVHRRILQQVYKTTFVTSAMSSASADRIIKHLVDASDQKSIKCKQFRDGFYATLTLILVGNLIQGDAVAAEIPRGSVTLPAGGVEQTTNIRNYMLLLAHGHIPVNTTDPDWNVWTTSFEGQTNNYADHNTAGRVWPNSDPHVTMKKLVADLYSQHKYWNDKRYIIHCLQKPAFEVPNPVILRSFLGEVSTPSASVDADGSQMLDNQRHHDFAHHLVNYFDGKSGFAEQDEAMRQLLEIIFKCYRNKADYLWTNVNSTPAAAYMQNSTTELPTLAYHGNLILDKHKKGHEEIRCVGHLGNSFPGSASIRQGKGMINLYERPPTAIHVI